jgi:hypothetical protein
MIHNSIKIGIRIYIEREREGKRVDNITILWHHPSLLVLHGKGGPAYGQGAS